MSKPFAYATSMGGEIYFTKASDKNTVDWFDNQGHVNMPLYTNNHAAELADALGKSIEQMQYAMQLYKPMGEDYTEIIGATVKAMTALTSYKESLK